MNFNLFIFYTKRKRLIRLFHIHYKNLSSEIETASRWFNWQKREDKLKKLALKLKISRETYNNIFLIYN